MADEEERLSALLRQVAAWQVEDPDPQARAELDTLVAQVSLGPAGAARDAALVDLQDRFSGPLQFGTAGLRARLGAGPHRMNRAVVIRAAAGVAAFLRQRVPGQALVVVGYDARRDSDVFARDTCAVVVGAGCRAMLLPRPLPTPVLAFAVRHLGADAGIMVTASHNPPQDNGYKVYLGGHAEPGDGRGAQIVPPTDADIAAQMAATVSALDVPMADNGWQTLGDDLLDTYLDSAVRVVQKGGPRALDVVLTPLHGVGGDTVVRALTAAGFAEPYVVPEQAAPDPTFPTVAFPNPEEPGALDLALAAARRRSADLVIANDPDADRCAVALPDPSGSGPAPWRMLRGDELGALLGEHLLRRRAGAGAPGVAGGSGGTADVVASSIVSSQLLARIAAAHGVRHVETLTGFKWIARVPGLIYGYEEAIGYCVAPELVRDKDGVTAALLIAELAATLAASGRTLLDALDDLALAHGVHATDQLALRAPAGPDLSSIEALMARLRADPPRTLGGQPVTSVEDLLLEGGLPPTDGLRYRTDGGLRVVVRPSGTEPKLKCYLEAIVPVAGSAAVRSAQSSAPQSSAQSQALARSRAEAARLLAHARADLTAALPVAQRRSIDSAG